MNICVISDALNSPTIAGAEVSILNICREMRSRGHTLNIITATPYSNDAKINDFQKEFNFEQVESPRLNILHDYTLVCRRRIAKRIAALACSKQPEIVQVHLVHNYASLNVIREIKKILPNIPVVLTIHDYSLLCKGALRCKFAPDKFVPNELHIPSKLTCLVCQKGTFNIFKPSYVLKTLNNYCDYVVFVSNFIRSFFLDNGLRTKSEVIYNGAIPNQHIATSSRRTPRDNFIAIAGGRMVERKGYRNILEALLKFNNSSDKSIQLVIYGNKNNFFEDLEKYVLNNKLEGQVVLKSWLDKSSLQELINSAHFGIVSSVYPDPLPRTIFEYGAAKLPIIASCIGGAVEMSESGHNYELYNTFSSNDLRDKMINIVNNYKIAQEKAEAFYSKILLSHTVECNVVSRERIYSSLLRN